MRSSGAVVIRRNGFYAMDSPERISNTDFSMQFIPSPMSTLSEDKNYKIRYFSKYDDGNISIRLKCMY